MIKCLPVAMTTSTGALTSSSLSVGTLCVAALSGVIRAAPASYYSHLHFSYAVITVLSLKVWPFPLFKITTPRSK